MIHDMNGEKKFKCFVLFICFLSLSAMISRSLKCQSFVNTSYAVGLKNCKLQKGFTYVRLLATAMTYWFIRLLRLFGFESFDSFVLIDKE